jgi:5-methylcytosine-specific restriction endonuclease McrA
MDIDYSEYIDNNFDPDVYKSPKSHVKRFVWDKTGGKCWYCGKQTHPYGQDRNAFCVDHVVPRILGGGNDVDNMVPACGYCNTIKGGKALDSFRDLFFSSHATDRRFWFEREDLRNEQF